LKLALSRCRPLLLGLCTAAMTFAAAHGVARANSFVSFSPPTPVVEAVPASPAPGYVWQPGYWSWNGVQYVWIPGSYVVAPYANAVWVPGLWSRREYGSEWSAGHWRH
jgi:hypothetical protein